MKIFELMRHEDVSGVSGIGVVAEGVEFESGLVVIKWRDSSFLSFLVYGSINDVIRIHGHQGRTEIVWRSPC